MLITRSAAKGDILLQGLRWVSVTGVAFRQRYVQQQEFRTVRRSRSVAGVRDTLQDGGLEGSDGGSRYRILMARSDLREL